MDGSGFLKKGITSAGSAPARPVARRTARSESSPPTPRQGGERWWTGNCICRSPGPRTRTGAERREFLTVAGSRPKGKRQRRSCGDGAKGPRLYDWAAARLPACLRRRPAHPSGWVLARRRVSVPVEIAYYLAYAPNGARAADLVRVAGPRWAIEEACQVAKNKCGLDQYEVRRYPGWHRHITLAMLAYAFLTTIAARTTERGPAETTPPAPSASPWQKPADSWTLCCPDPHPTTDQSPAP